VEDYETNESKADMTQDTPLPAPQFADLSHASARDLTRLLALNTAHEIETAPLSQDRLVQLLNRAFLALATPDGQALLITFDQDADYDSPNFLWFKARLPRFVYVDRIIVGAALRGRGIARQLYEQLIATAHAHGHAAIVCEVNSDPPNPASDAFHTALGFSNIGAAQLANGKTVQYLRRAID
jgi:uncharacterized protein